MKLRVLKKYRWIFAIQLLLLLLLLPGCMREEQLVFSDENVSVGESIDNCVYVGEQFTAFPGVYQVRVKIKELEGERLYVGAFCEQSSFRALRCNGANIYAGQEYLDFEIYALEEINTLAVKCDMVGSKAVIEQIQVYHTNLGARMLVLLYAVACVIVNGIMLFRKGVLQGTISREKQVVFWGLLISVSIAYFPYMTDYFSDAADISFHWLRIEGLKETLLQGNQFPVRVQSNWLYDHGYAVSLFYGDTFLIIPALLRIVGFSIMTSYKAFVFLVMVATAVIAYYSLKRCTGHTYASLFGSVIYVLAPYRIYNVYNRGAVGEYLAMTFMPLVICGMYLLYTGDVETADYKKAKLPLIAGLSCILQSHLLSCEMLVVGMLGICLIFYRRTFRKQTFLQLVQAALICLLLNAWFWIPLIYMLGNDSYCLSDIISQNIQDMGTWFAELFQLYPNKGTWQEGMYMAEPFQMGIASFLILIVTLTVSVYNRICLKKKINENRYERELLFWAILIVIGWFMSTRYFPWNMLAKIPGIKLLATAIQFPTRLFALVSVFAAFHASCFCLWLKKECENERISEKIGESLVKGIIVTLIILLVGSAAYHVNDIVYLSRPIWLYNAENMGTIRVINGEYMLKGTTVGDYYYHDPVAEEGVTWFGYRKQGTRAELSVTNHTSEALSLELPLIGYKGYVLKCSESEEFSPYISEIRGNHGDLRVIIPPQYSGVLQVSYKGETVFRIAEAISMITLLGLAATVERRRRKQWKTKHIEEFRN